VANLTALATVAAADIAEIQKASSYLAIVAFRNLMSVPSAFGVGIYTFQSAGIMIPLELSMANPRKLGTVLAWAFVLVGIIYSGFSVLGYMAFGEDTQQTITLNLQEGIVPIIVKGALCLCLLIALPLELNPMWELIERRFSQRRLSVILRALMVFVVCLFATTVKQLAVFLSLAGSSISCLLGFILPASLHLMIMKQNLEKPPSFLSMAADYVLIAFGLLFGAFGTTVSFIKLL
jgi:proton-coupled amino acid transporter